MTDYGVIYQFEDLSTFDYEVLEDFVQYFAEINFEDYYDAEYWEAMLSALKDAGNSIKELPPIPSLSLLVHPILNPVSVFFTLLTGIIKTIYMRTYYYYMNQRHQDVDYCSYNYSIAL